MSILWTKFGTKINRLEKQDCKYFLFIEIFQGKKVIRPSELNHSMNKGKVEIYTYSKVALLIKYCSTYHIAYIHMAFTFS